jgi:hypothetical protein
MCRPSYPLMDCKNMQLMNELNEFSIALKVWLCPEAFGNNLPALQKRFPKPDVKQIDALQHRINIELQKDATPLIKY